MKTDPGVSPIYTQILTQLNVMESNRQSFLGVRMMGEVLMIH